MAEKKVATLGKSPPPQKLKEDARKKSSSKPKDKTPAWWVFTSKSAAFAGAARQLSTAISDTYGEGVSISHFGRMLSELPQLTEVQRSLIQLDESILTLYAAYESARTARDEERESFRSFRNVQAVASGLEVARRLASGAGSPLA
jgi:hypothetical protein